MKKNRLYWTFFLVLQIIVLQLLGFVPEFVERFYSNGFYPQISKFSRTFLGWIPFSVGDLLYFLAIFFILKWIIKSFKTKKNWKNILLDIGAVISIFYFFFHILWALNYYRQPLFEKMHIEKEYSDADLLKFTQLIIEKTNAVQLSITHNPKQKVVSTLSQEEIFEKSISGYENVAQQHPFLKYQKSSIKKSLISLPLSYMGFSGYLNPFTNEAQVNDRIPMINFPFTTCHEMAHQIGYASESEANFIGFLAVIQNDDVYFKYSGYSAALRYCLRNWEVRNPALGKKLRSTINPGVLENFKDAAQHWKQYETFIEVGFEYFYDHFLKINKQEDGMESYSKFLNLLINYSKNHPFIF